MNTVNYFVFFIIRLFRLSLLFGPDDYYYGKDEIINRIHYKHRPYCHCYGSTAASAAADYCPVLSLGVILRITTCSYIAVNNHLIVHSGTLT